MEDLSNPITAEERKHIAELKAAIADPATPADKRADLKDELNTVLAGHAGFECLTDEWKRDYIKHAKEQERAKATATKTPPPASPPPHTGPGRKAPDRKNYPTEAAYKKAFSEWWWDVENSVIED